jgi:hypothetical protein
VRPNHRPEGRKRGRISKVQEEVGMLISMKTSGLKKNNKKFFAGLQGSPQVPKFDACFSTNKFLPTLEM